MTAKQTVLDALANGPRSRPQLEVALADANYAPGGICKLLVKMKQRGEVIHLQRPGGKKTSLYGLPQGKRGSSYVRPARARSLRDGAAPWLA